MTQLFLHYADRSRSPDMAVATVAQSCGSSLKQVGTCCGVFMETLRIYVPVVLFVFFSLSLSLSRSLSLSQSLSLSLLLL